MATRDSGKKGTSKGGARARSLNVPANLVEQIEQIRATMGESEITTPDFAKIAVTAMRIGLPSVAQQCAQQASALPQEAERNAQD